MNAAEKTSSTTAKRGRGKPTKYTPELAARIIEDIRRGMPVTKAYVGNSIGQTTGYVWTYTRPEFASAVQAARGQFRLMQAMKFYLRSLPRAQPVVSTSAADLYAKHLHA